ncbi:MAG: hypothetical protein CL476_12410 [Acidobacteria bacterium]|nr:hypothetical protein [Acidobacteriota bacterium]
MPGPLAAQPTNTSSTSDASPAQAATAPASSTTSAYVRNWTRIEGWDYFAPKPEGGDPTYAHISNRLQVGVEHRSRRFDVTGTLQYVQFGGLPSDSSGPGPYGTCAAYFGHSGDTSSNQVYLRYLNVRLKDLGPVSLQVGRMGYTSGTESPSGNGKIEALKNMRVASRIIGEFEWSIYQRGYDGIRADSDQPAWHATAIAFRPTQGGFEEQTGTHMSDLDLFGVNVSAKPDAVLPNSEVQLFAYRYDDRREVTGRPDNSGRSATRVGVKVNTFGGALIGAYPTSTGEIGTLLWLTGQTGSWYGQDHGAFAVAAEAGYQWSEAPWRPWLRGGVFRGTGDDDPDDDRHGTFFQMLPTVRKYSLSASYDLMNSADVFAQVVLRPTPPLNIRLDVHRITLTEGPDRWYFGSGATQNMGTIFGFGARPSGGETDFGTVVEGSAGYTINPHWSINGYVGLINGGAVVAESFDGDNLTFAYFEQGLRF